MTLIVSMVSLALIAAACSSAAPEAPAAPAAAPAAPAAAPAAPAAAPAKPAAAPAKPAAAPAKPAPAKPAPAPAAPAGQMGEGQTMNVLITNLGNGRFDTWLSDGEDLKFLRVLHAPLVGGEGGSSLIPGTVKAWDMSTDGKDWTFTVQDDFVTFQNGDKLTLADAHWTVDKMLGNEARRLETTGYYEPRAIGDAAKFNSVDLGPGSDQFTVYGKDPRPDIPFWMSENAQGPQGLIQPKAYSDSQIEAGDTGFEGFERAPIGAGPMSITDWIPEQKYSFERYADFWWHPGNGFKEDRRIKFEFLNMEVVPEDATRVAALQSGGADLIEANVLMQDGIKNAGAELAWQNESAYNWVIMVDCWQPDMWCWDARMRRAAEMAVDRVTIVDQLYGRGATAKGWSYVTPNSLGYSPELDPLPYDVAGAKALIADVGFAGDIKFEIHTWEAGDTPLLPELAQLMADAWVENLGWDVEVVVGDASAVRQQWNNRQLPGAVLVRTNEARYDGTSITTGSYDNKGIAWRMIDDPELEPWKSTTTVVVRKALADLTASRADSFNEAYRYFKNENHQWSAFYTNLPWGVGKTIKPGSYQPWTLVPYVTALWTAEPAN